MSEYSTYPEPVQEAVLGAGGELITLDDSHYRWVDKRRGCVRLGAIYDRLGWEDYADRARLCGTSLQYYVDQQDRRSLAGANFCQLRLCPMCIGRRARKMAWRLTRVMDMVEAQHDCRYIFLTLTVRNCKPDQLAAELDHLSESWHRLLKQRQFARTSIGWYRATEITRNQKTGEYHPHIHVIMAVSARYFATRSDIYITHAELLRYWMDAARLDYKPRVRIQVTRAKREQVGGRAAAIEASKYSVKDRDYIDPRLSLDQAGEIVRTYTEALKRRRMVGMGGVIREAALAIDGVVDDQELDLVHADPDAIREDLAVLVETYKWSFGVGDYILTSRRPL